MKQQNRKLSLRMKGEDVQRLQAALGQIGFSIADREGYFGKTTRQAVRTLQEQHGLEPTGVVDEETAELIEAAVAKPESDDRIHSEDKAPHGGVEHELRKEGTIMLDSKFPLALNDRGEQVAELQESLGKVGHTIPKHELEEQVFGVGTQNALLKLQTKYNLRRTGILDDATKAVLTRTVTVAETGQHQVEGRIFFDNGLPARDVTLRLYSRGFGGAETQLGEIKTDEQGFYALPYNPTDKTVNLEVRAVDTQGKEIKEIPLSATKFNADKHEVLNLVAPGSVQPRAAEYQRLTADLERQLGGLDKLAQTRENAERRDLTLLHQTTGWDARLIALAATAVKLGAETKIPQDALYALFRAGLPTDKQLLARVSATAVEKALNKAQKTGIVRLDDDQRAKAKAKFKKFAQETRRTAKAPGALSSVGDLLAKSGLTEAEQRKFEDLYFAHRGKAAELWEKAHQQGIPEEKIHGLRLQGKLACLTLNNAELTEKLQQEIGSVDNLAQLVDKDLHQSDAWKGRLKEMAGNDEQGLQALIPPAYEGKTTGDRLEAYAADLARKVRLSFPTQIVVRMIDKDELCLGDRHDALKAPVRTFLNNATALGFELGRKPVDAFVNQNREEVFRGIAPADVKATTQSIKLLHRLYQITPTNEALKQLLDLGFTSACEVTSFAPEVFLSRFGHSFPSRREAELVYRKAQQVSAVTLNLVTMAQLLDSTPPVYAIFPPPAAPEARRGEAKVNLINHFSAMEVLFGIRDYVTMEALFRSMDFCECEHCRSVLSPAAYFVDLLQFLEHPGGSDSDAAETPYDVLIERRPDLPHLSLTCENTNTALPYIDIVNEILEYYVANNGLDKKAAHDTGDATTPELLAEPQNVLRQAYDTLKDQAICYPLSLPFDLWLETVRQFFNHFETPLWQVLEVFRTSDDLFAPTAAYDRAAIFAEYLGISPAEYSIFTDFDPMDWYHLYGYGDQRAAITPDHDEDDEQRIDLNSAKTLSRRLGVSYKELVDLVCTAFVNPQLDVLVTLRKLGVDADDVFRYKEDPLYPAFTPEEQAAFEERLENLSETFEFDAAVWLDGAWAEGEFNQILVLADPSAGCNFNETVLQHADGDPTDALAFLKLNLFVRLWKKLGWTIEETDRALQVFLPGEIGALDGADIWAALKTALVYIAHLKALDEKLKLGKDSRLKLLTLWSNLPTTGKNPLYAQLFLTQSVLKSDPVFDHPLGQYLCYSWDATQPEDAKTGNVSLYNHLLTLQGALNLTADEVGLILADAKGQPLAQAQEILRNEPLTLANVSSLYRYGLLARALQLSVRDLIVLKSLSGLNPFEPLHPDPLETLADDYPFTQTLRFIEVVDKVKESGFQVEDLDYLLRHRFDPVGKYRPDPDVLLAMVKSLAADIRRIQAEHAVPDDPATLTDDLLRQKLALVLPPDVVETFMAMWTGTVEYEAIYGEEIEPDQKLDPETFALEQAIRVNYDGLSKVQKLTYRGVLLDTEKARLTTSYPSLLLAALLDAVQQQAMDFFEANFIEVEPPFLTPADFDLLFAPVPPIDDDLTEAEEQMRNKRARLAQAFLPYLQQKLTRQFVVQTLATSLNADPALTEALLTNTGLLTDPSQSDHPLLDAFAATSERGVSAAFFASTDGTGAPLETRIATAADTTDKPPEANSARLAGYLEVPAAGAYRFYAVCEKRDAEAEFRFAHLTDPLLRGTAASDGEEIDQLVELKAGVLYHFTLDARNLGGGDVELLIRGENLPRGSLARLTLYPQTIVERVHRARILLAKTLQLTQGLELSEREVRYLLTHADDFDDLSLSQLPTRAADDSPAGAMALFGQFLRLADYARLKRDLAGSTDDLISIFENARHIYPTSADAVQATADLFEDLCQRVADLTRRDIETVRATAEHLGFTPYSTSVADGLQVAAPDFAREKGIQRLWEGLQVVEKLGVPVGAVVRWATPAPDYAISRDLRNTVKARYEPENWQLIAPPIFDKLRQRQRDALVAYVLHNHPQGFKNANQLFEYFLIDPGMEPVVQTSRIRLAISSVQLFIQRCLLNLEPQVRPSAINSKHWQWMKRYRVWEANRKIFLYPENWLEPEFRDDKTHLFQEFESALLQGDVSNDLAEDAFFQYLKKLEELARLDIVTMYCEEKSDDPESNVLHVIGRTYNPPHKYFYRRYAHHMWTPWEPVTTEIEGDHVVAVVWRERLHLFWVTFLEKARPVETDDDTSVEERVGQLISTTVPEKEVEAQLNWCEYFQGQWTTSQSSGFGNPICVDVADDFDKSEVFIHVSKEEHGVKINLMVPGGARAIKVPSKNSQPEIGDWEWPLWHPYYPLDYEVTRYKGSFPFLRVSFKERIESDDEELFTYSYKPILQRCNLFTLLMCNHPFEAFTEEIASLCSPFFYQDNRHTFFVEPTLTETPIVLNEEWGVGVLRASPLWDDGAWREDISLQPEAPVEEPPFLMNPIGPYARFMIQPQKDWATDPVTVLLFDGRLVGQSGGLDSAVMPADTEVDALGTLVNVGGGGLTSALLRNLNARRLPGGVSITR